MEWAAVVVVVVPGMDLELVGRGLLLNQRIAGNDWSGANKNNRWWRVLLSSVPRTGPAL